MSEILKELASIILLGILILGILSSTSLFVRVSSVGSETVVYTLNKGTNLVKSVLYIPIKVVYKKMLTIAFVIDLILSLTSPEAKTEQEGSKLTKVKGSIVALKEFLRAENKRMIIKDAMKRFIKKIFGKVTLTALGKRFAKAVVKMFFSGISYSIIQYSSSDKATIRGGIVYLKKGESVQDVSWSSILGKIGERFILPEIIAFIAGVIYGAIFNFEVVGYPHGPFIPIAKPELSFMVEIPRTFLVLVGIDVFTDYMIRQIYLKMERVFYGPIFVDVSSKDGILKRIYSCYDMVGRGKWKVEYLRATPTACYVINFISDDNIYLKNITDYVTETGIDIPVVVCKVTNSSGKVEWKCAEILNGNTLEFNMGKKYPLLSDNEPLASKITIDKVILRDKDNGDVLKEIDLNYAKNMSWVFISYTQCIDWDDMTWGAGESLFNPEYRFVSFGETFLYGFAPPLVDVCKPEDERGIIFVVFWTNMIGVDKVDIEYDIEKA